ncbi:hypothetical protein AAHA92_15138 [Salvia divinorum]|uniref:Uncharacterized protein n=1 Tax=Salvia divinorum TaxID=28513 RepID=A0ABD1HDT0_SALDI
MVIHKVRRHETARSLARSLSAALSKLLNNLNIVFIEPSRLITNTFRTSRSARKDFFLSHCISREHL